ncbi:hypothetical protein FITA111629_03270 [Filibacter tadaridae]|uniref:Uncharacterized protein n=1 Tax=Filibacter tadaridae TaxID=2483811 RepID=A0A3P5XFT2_9BACL|nr:hypothetical protein [Filibacter tadaridae]VDC27448.1 hypothetical protein FILTAD_01572 [Filibacter tadaridae]
MKEEYKSVETEKKIMELPKEVSSFSSPTSAVSEEETRILTEYNDQRNMFKIINLHEPHRKTLTLKKFFKVKRNQQVVISSVIEKDGTLTTEGKVAAIGRDFVMLTDLQKRIWIPYAVIETANIPFGFPTYSNSHQHHIYDNQLRRKLMLNFGETVTKREALVQQFFEESLRTNLHSWKGTWVEVVTNEQLIFGNILKTTNKELFLKRFNAELSIPLKDVRFVSTFRLFSLCRKMLHIMFSVFHEKLKGGRKDG